ncbi:hypothetical protein BUQ74_14205 [Leptospira weilii serovar Heyan]|uniref:Uncharacterized protein n=2 Tax=Leptospira weilii TaxID=28184 RepID=M6QII4_9LEPT|nr:hypothetical protein LEP1GSC108_1251 [Leptospira weilii str. UI 13098]OMI16662.1 hypothetical protein BUQ74_14205 [Leptospira weilii serovar Heyan]
MNMKCDHFVQTLIEETEFKFLQSKKKWPTVEFKTDFVLIGVRGISIINNEVLLNDNSFDYFNDILFNIYPGAKSWGSRVATMDPGKVSKETLLKYGIKDGEARTEEGLYLVKIGFHRGHKAFVQASPFYYRRDVNEDRVRNELDPLYYDQVGLNIHAQNVQKDSVGVSSLGYTVTKITWDEPEWIEFISVFKEASIQARIKNPKFSGFCYAVLNQNMAKKIFYR